MFRTVFIALRSGDENKPFGLIRKLLLSLLEPQEFSTDQEQKAYLEKLLLKVYDTDVKREKAMIAMKIILDLKWSNDPNAVNHDKSNLNGDRTVRDVLQSIFSKQTTAIAIENGQYCDELSWNEILVIVDMPARVAILITLCSLQTPGLQNGNADVLSRSKSRKSPSQKSQTAASLKTENQFGVRLRATEFFQNIESRPNCMIVDLPPLTKDDVGRILNKILETEVEDPIIKLVHDASSGNPFWCQLIAHYIKDSGLDEFNNAYKNNKNRNPLNVVFICRLEKLQPDHQVIARYASVIGDEFTMDRLHNILPARYQSNLENCLSILSEYGFILCVGQNPPSYAFQNLLIRKFLYDLTPYSEVVKIHEAIARYIEAENADNLRPYYSVLVLCL